MITTSLSSFTVRVTLQSVLWKNSWKKFSLFQLPKNLHWAGSVCDDDNEACKLCNSKRYVVWSRVLRIFNFSTVLTIIVGGKHCVCGRVLDFGSMSC